MNDETTVRLKSKRCSKEFSVTLYESAAENGDRMLVIKHASLEDLYWNQMGDMERPEYDWELLDTGCHPYTQPVKALRLNMKKNSFTISTIGEMTDMEWRTVANPVNQQNPLQICRNRAFDKALIRYLQFDVSGYNYNGTIYSSSEIVLQDRQITVSAPKADPGQTAQTPIPAQVQERPIQPAVQDMGQPSMNGQRDPRQIQNNVQTNVQGQGRQSQAASEMRNGNAARGPQPANAIRPQPNGGAPYRNAPQAAPRASAQTVPGQGVPQKPAQRGRLDFLRVYYDQAAQLARIETSVGLVSFSDRDHRFYCQTADLSAYDMDILYREVSQAINCDLSRYRG